MMSKVGAHVFSNFLRGRGRNRKIAQIFLIGISGLLIYMSFNTKSIFMFSSGDSYDNDNFVHRLIKNLIKHGNGMNAEHVNSCEEKTNLVYVKMIKAASQTMVSILRRFGYYRNLSFVLPPMKKIYLGWPYQMEEEFYRPKKTKEFNILCEHSVYNSTLFRNLMPKNTFYLVSIREPYAQFKSMFRYYNLQNVIGINSADPIGEYLQNIVKYEEIYKSDKHEVTSKRYCIPNNFSMSSNLMSFNLGFPTGAFGLPDRTNDDEYISNWLLSLEDEFDLVMIVEYFFESLVLLRRKLCWTWKDIMFQSSNVAENYVYKKDHNQSNIDVYKKWSRVDYKLYDHFNQTFWRLIYEEGPDLHNEVFAFKNTQRAVLEFCNSNDTNQTAFMSKENKWTVAFNITKQNCVDIIEYTVILQYLKDRYDTLNVNVTQPLKSKRVVC